MIDETDDEDSYANTPHAFVLCVTEHLFPRTDAHCGICDRMASDPIHAAVKVA